MIKLSAVIITFNEERNIGRCIDSLQSIADDIVVVDSFSKDKTKEITLSKNARFVEHAFEGHIEQKNWAITQAKFPHILSLDADEALDETLKKTILEVKKNWVQDAYKMNRLTNYCGQWIKHCGWYPDTKLRLWDSTKGHWTGTNPHDEYRLHSSTKIGVLTGDILHYSFDTVEQHKKQIDFFSDIAAKALHAKGKKANFIYLLVKPVAKFIKSYLLKLGFLEGYYGLIISWYSAGAKYKKYSKLITLNK